MTNDIYTTEDAEFLRSTGVLPDERIAAVQTGGCPHTAIRDDISANLEAVEELEAATGPLDVVFVESGGDNLTAIFSPALADVQIFVIDVAGGDDIPRKGGPGIARADLLAINKTDLAPLRRRRRRADGPRGLRAPRRAAGRRDLAARATAPARSPTGSAAARRVPRRTATCTRAWKACPITTTITSTRTEVARVRRRRRRELRRGRGSRRGCSAPGRITLLRSQAGPLAGDHDRVEIVVESGTLTVEPVAATVALPGAGADRAGARRDGRRRARGWCSRTRRWSSPRARTCCGRRRSGSASGAVAIVRDLVVLGRAGEGPGRLESVLRAEGPDGVILHDALRVEPATWDADAYVALAPGHRAIGTVARLGEPGGAARPRARGAGGRRGRCTPAGVAAARRGAVERRRRRGSAARGEVALDRAGALAALGDRR